jgi:hypothetical protein
MGNLLPGLTNPVDVALAKAVDHLPGPHSVPGGQAARMAGCSLVGF